MVSLRLQFFTFFNMILVGMVLGIIFDFYRVFRGKIKINKFITGVLDLLFAVIIACLTFIVLIYSNNGEIRIYIFLGILVGCLIYYLIFSKMVIILYIKIFNFIYWLYSKFKKIFLVVYNRLKLIIIRLKKLLIKLKT